MNKLVVSLVGLLLLLGGAVFVLQSGLLDQPEEPRGDGPAVGRTDVDEDEDAADPAHLVASDPGTAAVAEPVEPARDEPERTAVVGDPGDLPVVVDPDEALRIRIVEQESGDAVPGAEVVFLSLETMQDEREIELAFMRGGDIYSMLERFGTKHRANSEGIALVPDPGPRGEAVVAARAPGLRAILPLRDARRDGDEVLLELERDLSVQVQVVDATGVPQSGVPVVLRADEGEWDRDVWRAHTDGPDGLATFSDLEMLIRESSRGEDEVRFSFALGVLAADAPEIELDAEALPQDTLRLELPPTGSVEVRVLDNAGEPVGEGYFVAARLVQDEEDGTNWVRSREAPVQVVDGVARIDHVGLGARVGINAGRMDGGDPLEEIVDGPIAAGEVVAATMRFEGEDTVLFGRLVDEAGDPLASAPFEYRVRTYAEHGSMGWSGRRGRTEEDGAFELIWRDSDDQPGWTRREIEFIRETRDEALDGTVDLSFALPGPRVDLGDVRLTQPPLIASGRVVDENGDPLRGADVVVQRKVYWGERIVDESGEQRFYWQQEWPLRTATDRQGAFAIRGRVEDGELGLGAQREGYYSEADPTSFVLGATDVELVLNTGGSVAGNVVVDEHVPFDAVNVYLDRGDEQGHDYAHVDDEGEFEFLSLSSGSFDLVVELEGTHEEVRRIEGVSVEAGGDSEDARLRDIDLRGSITYVALTLVDEDGDPVEGAQIWVDPTGEAGDSPDLHAWDRRPVRIATGKPSVDLRIEANGYRRVELEDVSSDREVVLASGIPVRVVVSPAPSLPPSHELQLQLHQVAGGGSSWTDWAEVDGSGEVALRLAGPGTHRAQFTLYSNDEHSSTGVTVASGDGGWPELDVLDTSQEQLFYVELSPEQIDAALEQLQDL